MRKGKGNIKAQKRKYKQRHKSIKDQNVDKLLQKNISKLKEICKFPYQRTDGEDAIARALSKLGIRYIPEYYTGKLEGDTKAFRLADFYLPHKNIYIEFLGNWNTSEEHKKRYKHKMAIYFRNHMDFIPIFPNQLFNISWILKKKIKQIYDKRKAEQEESKRTHDDNSKKIIHLNEKMRVFVKLEERIQIFIDILLKLAMPAIIVAIIAFFVSNFARSPIFKKVAIYCGGIYAFCLILSILILVIIYICKLSKKCVVFVIDWFRDLYLQIKMLVGR